MPLDKGLTVAIAIPKGGRPPALGAPDRKSEPPTPTPMSQPDATPDSEPDGDESIKPNPEAVDYRTEAESCGHCSYFDESGWCQHPIVQMQVGPGDSCAAFEAKGDNMEEQGEPKGQSGNMGEEKSEGEYGQQ